MRVAFPGRLGRMRSLSRGQDRAMIGHEVLTGGSVPCISCRTTQEKMNDEREGREEAAGLRPVHLSLSFSLVLCSLAKAS